MPASAISRTTFMSRFTMTGARPSESSSTMTSVGSVASARAMTSICCSPPRAQRRADVAALVELGEQREGALQPVALGDRLQVLLHRQVGESRPALLDVREPAERPPAA